MFTSLRPALARAIRPVARGLVRIGVTADLVTVVGTVGAVAAALLLLARGHLVAGSLVVTAFACFDMLDGAVARERGGTGRWGAFLDSTLDRVSDAALLGALAWWYTTGGDQRAYAVLALGCLVGSFLVSYVKARAESLGYTVRAGVAERAARFIVVVVGAFLAGLGVPYAMGAALVLLAAGVLVTVVQRMADVHAQATGRAGHEDRAEHKDRAGRAGRPGRARRPGRPRRTPGPAR